MQYNLKTLWGLTEFQGWLWFNKFNFMKEKTGKSCSWWELWVLVCPKDQAAMNFIYYWWGISAQNLFLHKPMWNDFFSSLLNSLLFIIRIHHQISLSRYETQQGWNNCEFHQQIFFGLFCWFFVGGLKLNDLWGSFQTILWPHENPIKSFTPTVILLEITIKFMTPFLL